MEYIEHLLKKIICIRIKSKVETYCSNNNYQIILQCIATKTSEYSVTSKQCRVNSKIFLKDLYKLCRK